jgi:predicted transcriptional regulator
VCATELLNKLVNSGLVTCTKEDNSVIYKATPAGFGFVNRYSELVSMLCPGSVPQTRLAELKVQGAWT